MGASWHSTKFPGVRYREHNTRKYKGKPDQYFVVRYQFDGKRHTERVGWSSEKWTPSMVYDLLAELKRNQSAGIRPFTLKEKRQMLIAERDAEIRLRKERAENTKTIQEWCEEYLDWYYSKERRTDPYEQERSLARHYIYPQLGNIPIHDLTAKDAEKFLRWLEKQTGIHRKTVLAPRTVESIFAILRKTLGYAGIKDRVTAKVEWPKYDNESQRFFTKEEAEMLLARLREKKQKLYDQAIIALHCGLRAGEIHRLRVMNVDFKSNLLHVMDGKNKNRNRSLPMTEEVREAVKRNMKHAIRKHHRVIAYKDKKPFEYLFIKVGTDNEPQTTLSRSHLRTINELGLNDGIDDRRFKAGFHTLRHTYASWLIMSGKVTLYTLMKLLGHQSIKTTERYAKLAPDHLRESAVVMDDIWKG